MKDAPDPISRTLLREEGQITTTSAVSQIDQTRIQQTWTKFWRIREYCEGWNLCVESIRTIISTWAQCLPQSDSARTYTMLCILDENLANIITRQTANMSGTYENSVYLAKLAEQAERYEGIVLRSIIRILEILTHAAEMVENMKKVASEDQELSVEERNLLSVAYKNVIGARRASWRIVTSIEQKEESKGNTSQVSLIKEYRQKIEAELAKICEDILEVLDKHLIPSAQSGESKVFYHKM